MPKGFFPPQHQQAASKELSGLEIPSMSASSFKFQGNAFLTIFLLCRLQACGAASHLVPGRAPSLRPQATWGQKGYFPWPQMDLFMWLPSAEPAVSPGYGGRVKNFSSLGTPALLYPLSSTHQNFHLGSCIFRHIFPQLSFWSTMAVQPLLQLLRKSYTITVGWCTVHWTSSYTWTKKKVLHASKI